MLTSGPFGRGWAVSGTRCFTGIEHNAAGRASGVPALQTPPVLSSGGQAREQAGTVRYLVVPSQTTVNGPWLHVDAHMVM